MIKYLLFLLFFVSCNSLERRGSISTEKGYVVAMSFSPEINGHGTTTTFNSNGGIGIGSTSIHANEQWTVVFRCQHGMVFTIDRKELYNKLTQGDSVAIDYYELVNKEGIVKDLDFVDANKISK